MRPDFIVYRGGVLLGYPRRWWQLWLPGWERHRDAKGRRCWLRFPGPPVRFPAGLDT